MKKLKRKEKNTNTKENLPEIQEGQKKTKITDPILIAKALIATEGNEHASAEILGITTKTLRKHIKNNDVLIDVKDHILSKQISFVEEQLMALISLKDFQAIKFFLENKGKDHGWGKNAVETGMTQKTGVLLVNNLTVNNANLNPQDWSQTVKQMREDQKVLLDEKAIELEIIDKDDE